MKRTGQKGFTLIELLAVITIMGILMLVAIPAVSRTIENSRRDTFATVSAEYVNAVRNAVLADNISCDTGSSAAEWTVASATPDGWYYFPICTSSATGDCAVAKSGTRDSITAADILSSTKDLMESGGRSPFGNSDLRGYVLWHKETKGLTTDNPKTTTTYTIILGDKGKHGFAAEKNQNDLKRANVLTTGAKFINNPGDDSTTTAASNQKPCKVN